MPELPNPFVIESALLPSAPDGPATAAPLLNHTPVVAESRFVLDEQEFTRHIEYLEQMQEHMPAFLVEPSEAYLEAIGFMQMLKRLAQTAGEPHVVHMARRALCLPEGTAG